jgi:polysaccharide export outer membrane protein
LFLALLTSAWAQGGLYQLQPGDTVSISVWQDSKLDRQVIVGPDGMISFPLAGQIRAQGQTLQGIASILRNRLQANYNTTLDVTVALTGAAAGKDRMFYVTGEVNKPGAYPLVPETSILQAIALFGGFSPFAATQRIEIYRRTGGQDAKWIFNYRDFVSGRDLSGNIDLRPGDVVVVPEKGLFEH